MFLIYVSCRIDGCLDLVSCSLVKVSFDLFILINSRVLLKLDCSELLMKIRMLLCGENR